MPSTSPQPRPNLNPGSNSSSGSASSSSNPKPRSYSFLHQNEPFQIFLAFLFVINLVLEPLPFGTPQAAQAAAYQYLANTATANDKAQAEAQARLQTGPGGPPTSNAAPSDSNSVGAGAGKEVAQAQTQSNSLTPVQAQAQTGPSAGAAGANATQALKRLPLAFEPNGGGQTKDNSVKYLARGAGYNLFLTGDRAFLRFRKAPTEADYDETDSSSSSQSGTPDPTQAQAQGQTNSSPNNANNANANTTKKDKKQPSRMPRRESGAVLGLEFVGGAANPSIIAGEAAPTKFNYLTGAGAGPGPDKTDQPSYGRILYQNLYPGIGLTYYGQAGELEYDFTLAPGANPNAIRLRFNGADALSLSGGGDLLIKLGDLEVRQAPPLVYQTAPDGSRQSVTGKYLLLKGAKDKDKDPPLELGFEVGSYDPARPLVIDPVLTYSGYLGGSGIDIGLGLAVDTLGQVYVTGQTASPNFTGTVGAYQRTPVGGTDAFVTKIDATGTTRLLQTYLGSSGEDYGTAIAVDAAQNIYVTGRTSGTNFPVLNAYQSSLGGSYDAFLTKLNPAGSALLYSTYLGGSGYENAVELAVDGTGKAYVTGYVTSTNFPVTGSAYRSTKVGGTGNDDVFLTQLNTTLSGGASLLYSTYFGGTGNERGYGVALDGSGAVYVGGGTSSTDFPTKLLTTSLNGPEDGFVAKFNLATGVSGLNTLVYSRYLGGGGTDDGGDSPSLAVDSAGNVIFAGQTDSGKGGLTTPLATTAGAVQSAYGGGEGDGFVAALNSSGAVTYMSYLGGNGFEDIRGVATDGWGNAYVTGYLTSTNFPRTAAPGTYPPAANVTSFSDAFVTKINTRATTAGTTPKYSTYLGGTGSDTGWAIAVDRAGSLYVGGTTNSSDFPTTAANFGTSTGGSGGNDAFVLKLTFDSLEFTTSPAGTILAGDNLSPAPKITVRDYLGQKDTGFSGPVSLTIKSGSGTAGAVLGGTGTTTLTVVNGEALFTGLTLDRAGTNYRLTASSPLLAVVDSAPFTITARPAASITATGGTPQSTPISTTFPLPLKATVKNDLGQTIAGVSVTFQAPASAGVASGRWSGGATSVVVTTDASGIATAPAFTATGVAGSYSVNATVSGVATGASFALTNTTTAPYRLSAEAGTPQNATINTAFATPLKARVWDAGNNPLSGVAVQFTAPAPGSGGVATALFNGSPATSVVTVTTDAAGYAQTPVLTAGGVAGSYTVAASLPAYGGVSPASFALTNTVGAVSNLVVVAGSPQSTVINTAFATALKAQVRDSGGNGVSGIGVTFVAPGPGPGASGSFSPSSLLSVTVTTDGLGYALAPQFGANSVVGSYSVQATASGAAAPVSFSLTNTVGAAASILAVAGTPQSSGVGTAFPVLLKALVQDAYSNPVSGATVLFEAPASGASGLFDPAGGGGGSPSLSVSVTTDAEGYAQAPQFTANAIPGAYSVSASLPAFPAVSGAPFALTNTQPGLTFNIGPGDIEAGSPFNPPLVVNVEESPGRLLTSFNGPVTLAIKSGSGTAGAVLSGTATVNTVNGVASFASLSIDRGGSGYVLVASSPSLASIESIPFDISLPLTQPGSILAWAGSSQSTLIANPFPTLLVARVLNSQGQPLAAQSVTFQAPGAGASGSFGGGGGGGGGGGSSFTGSTDARGFVTTTVLTGNSTAGSYEVIASTPGLAQVARFSLTNVPSISGSDVKLTLNPPLSGPNPLNSSVTLTVSLKRQDIVPLVGQSVNLTATDASGNAVSLATSIGTTNASGEVSFSYTNAITASHTLTATTSVSGELITSNPAQVFWSSSPVTVTTSSIQGRFYQPLRVTNPDEPYPYFNFTALPTDTPLFKQNFSSLIFNPAFSLPGGTAGVDNYAPLRNLVYDDTGQAIGSITAQGNEYIAGLNPNNSFDLSKFQAVFTGQFVVKTAGVVTLAVSNDDFFRLGVGNGATLTDGTIPTPTTPIEGYPVFATFTNAQLGSQINLKFPAPGIYPFEIDYTQCCAKYGLYLNLMVRDVTGQPIPPVGTLTLQPTIITTTLPLDTAQVFTATLKNDADPGPHPVFFVVTGANPQQKLVTADANGQALFSASDYARYITGTDTIQAFSWVGGVPVQSNQVKVTWTTPTSGGGGPPPGAVVECNFPPASPSLLADPKSGISTSGNLLFNLSANTTLVSGTLTYWSAANPLASAAITLGVNLGGTSLPSLDTTKLSNGSYVAQLCEKGGTTPSVSRALFTVVGENKPGRVAFSLTDFTVPVSGLPIVIGRTYDSLDRDKAGDFGPGWTLSIGNPRLEVNPANDVTLTLLDGKRVTFYFTPSPCLGWCGPAYTPEPGVYGTLTQSGGPTAIVPTASGWYGFPGALYNPHTYYYRDVYGRQYEISKLNDPAGKFTLRSLLDTSGNKLTFSPTGISSNAGGLNVQFVRNPASDPNCPNCITQITDTATGVNQGIYKYEYASTDGPDFTRGDLISMTLPGILTPTLYTYFTAPGSFKHLFKSAKDPRGNPVATTEYYTDADGNKLSGRLKTVKDALSQTFTYTYDLSTPYISSTTVTNPDTTYRTSVFDAYGKLLNERDELGRTITNTYDLKHNPTQYKDAIHQTDYEYDPAKGYGTKTSRKLDATTTLSSTTIYNEYGGPRVMTNEEGQPTSVDYTPSGNNYFLPTSVTDGLGAMGDYSFYSQGNVERRYDANGQATLFTYDPYGNKTTETDPLGRTTSYEYDLMGRMTVMTDALGVKTKTSYDALGRTISTTAAVGTGVEVTTLYGYDGNSNRITMTVAAGTADSRPSSYKYDAANRLIEETRPDGSKLGYTYDFRGNKLTEVLTSNTTVVYRTNKYEYNEAGQLVTTTLAFGKPEAEQSVVGYDPAGRRISEKNARNATTTYEYDALDRLVKINVPINAASSVTATTSYTYDKTGRKLTQTDPNLIPTSYGYDVRGRLTLITYATGITVGMSYDLAGNLKTRYDQANRKTSYSYDEANRLLTVVNPKMEGTDYHYDKLGRLSEIIDANSHHTNFQYDELGRQKLKKWADTSTFETWGYDRVGNSTSHRLGDGQTNLYEYDPLNRLTKIQYYDEGVATQYSYNPASLRATVIDKRGTTAYTYDGRDRLKTIILPGTATPSVSYTYDPVGNRTELTTLDGTTGYTYDEANRLKTVHEAGVTPGLDNTYTYDNGGRRTQLQLANSAVITYSYDTLNRLVGLNHYSQIPSGTPLSSYVYSYDQGVAAGKVGLKTGVTEYQGSSTAARTLAWVYDDADRLKSEAWTEGALPAVTTSFTYDKTGNRQSQTIGSALTSYEYNALDQLKTVTDASGVKTYTYDKRGNLSKIGQGSTTLSSFTFNGADRLVQAQVSVGPSSLYTYDADGRRIKAVVGSTTTNYLWDEASRYGDVVRETDGSGSLKTSYTLSGVSGELISQKRGSNAPEYYLLDGRGSVRGLATKNASNAVVVNDRYAYDAFGTAHAGSAATFGTTANVYRYTSQQVDSATGLYDLRARYYNPTDGRFLSRDSYTGRGSSSTELNRYVYTANNPANFSDPSGYSTTAAAPPQSSGGASEYGLIQTFISIFALSALTALSLALTCVLALDVSKVIAATGGDPDIVPAPQICKVNKQSNTCASKFPNIVSYDSASVPKSPASYYAGEKGYVWSSGYIFDSRQQALAALTAVIKVGLTPFTEDESLEGPCKRESGYEVGTHQTFGAPDGQAVASIVSCPCCIINATTHQPERVRKWAVINLRENYLKDPYDDPF